MSRLTATQMTADDVDAVLAFYAAAYDPDLRCAPEGFPVTPQRGWLLGPERFGVLVHDGTDLVGVCVIKRGAVYYPAMIGNPGDRVRILKALLEKAFELNGNRLDARTDNPAIHGFARSALGGRVQITGSDLRMVGDA